MKVKFILETNGPNGFLYVNYTIDYFWQPKKKEY